MLIFITAYLPSRYRRPPTRGPGRDFPSEPMSTSRDASTATSPSVSTSGFDRSRLAFDVEWRPYQLNPGMLEGGMDRREYRAAKFGAARSDALDRQMVYTGAEIGLSFRYDLMERKHEDVLAALAYLFVSRGPPANIRSDSGSGFIATAVQQWLGHIGVKTLYIASGSPWRIL